MPKDSSRSSAADKKLDLTLAAARTTSAAAKAPATAARIPERDTEARPWERDEAEDPERWDGMS